MGFCAGLAAFLADAVIFLGILFTAVVIALPDIRWRFHEHSVHNHGDPVDGCGRLAVPGAFNQLRLAGDIGDAHAWNCRHRCEGQPAVVRTRLWALFCQEYFVGYLFDRLPDSAFYEMETGASRSDVRLRSGGAAEAGTRGGCCEGGLSVLPARRRPKAQWHSVFQRIAAFGGRVPTPAAGPQTGFQGNIVEFESPGRGPS